MNVILTSVSVSIVSMVCSYTIKFTSSSTILHMVLAMNNEVGVPEVCGQGEKFTVVVQPRTGAREG